MRVQPNKKKPRKDEDGMERMLAVLRRRPPAVFSKEGATLQVALEPFRRQGVKVSPSRVLGPRLPKEWECRIRAEVTGFSVQFRLNKKRDQESIDVIAPQGTGLRRSLEGAILAWWQDLLPSEGIVPLEEQ